MVIETSALIAVIAGEPEAETFLEAITEAPSASLSAASYVEAGIVLERFPADAAILDDLLIELDIDIVAVTATQARLARDAFRDFGKGRHPAALNYGDCFSYALAKAVGEPLLFKGDDFARTDLAAPSI
jgi:ribonuclease VapC